VKNRFQSLPFKCDLQRYDEVKLFYTLIQMLRSPDILIKVTRNKDV
jgi:hypothetical protein